MYENPFEERFLVITEKPSVAMTIAAVLGCRDKKDGYMESPDGVVSWCIGHLADYAMPEAYDARYKKWNLDELPVIPENWKLVVAKDREKQFRILCSLLNNRMEGCAPFTCVVNAADPGREGEAIFNRVYELSKSTLPVKRLWVSSMEDQAVMKAFLDMKDAAEYRNLGAAAVCRAQADWLIGMNASRAFTSAYDCRFSVGRVQSPTLAMLAEREEKISHFQKEQYFIAHLTVDSMGTAIDAVSEHFFNREEANRLAGMCSGRTASVSSIRQELKTARPPLLYDLTSLQRDANRLLGFSAAKTLEYAQSLYEKKLITYPRTDSRYLTDDMGQAAEDVLAACGQVFPFLSFAASPSGRYRPDIERLLDSRKVTDHYAIIPTEEIRKTGISECSAEEKKILTLIAARLACAVGEDHVYMAVRASFLCCGYTFTAVGKNLKNEGWKAVEKALRKELGLDHADEDDPDGENTVTISAESGGKDQDLSSLYEGARFPDPGTRVSDHWTKPPAQYTEDTLLLAMERAGSTEMEADVERKGLGTPATRASIIEKLIRSGYAVRRKRQVIITDAGKQLVSVLPEYLKSARMTADWENRLLQVERGQYGAKEFMDGIVQMVHRIVRECRELDTQERSRIGSDARGYGKAVHAEIGKCPVCESPVYEGEKNFYCADRGCRFVLWKENRYLDRMRTCLDAGMAKDLLARGRTTVKDLYSPKKDSFFTADLLMEWKDGSARYSLDFPDRKTGRKTAAGSRKQDEGNTPG